MPEPCRPLRRASAKPDLPHGRAFLWRIRLARFADILKNNRTAKLHEPTRGRAWHWRTCQLERPQ